MYLGLVLYSNSIEDLACFYAQVFQFSRADTDDSYIRLTHPAAEIVILQAASQYQTVSTEPRESTPIKPVFFTDKPIATMRKLVISSGGSLKPIQVEWLFHQYVVCDGHDLEGNIFQVRSSQGVEAISK